MATATTPQPAAKPLTADEQQSQRERTHGKFKDVTIVESKDEQIHLPEGMSLSQGANWLKTIEENEEQKISWSAMIDAYPLDGALALRNVLQRRYGSAVKSGAQGFWGTEIPPWMIAIEVGVGKTEYVPWGYFIIPPMPGQKIQADIAEQDGRYVFSLAATIARKNKKLMDEIADDIRREVRTASIYKGQAFRISFPEDGEEFSPLDFAPKFIDTASSHAKLIFSKKVAEQIETNLFTPVEHTEECVRLGVPLKRGVLLEGKYGTGKTLTAHLLAKKCVENGWTFIYVEDIKDLEEAMRFARRYEPAVLFAEDIDSVMEQKSNAQRDSEMNEILNTIDGVDMKQAKQMVVLTTNFVERINKAMIRPGRLDAVISIEPPDEEAIAGLMKHYAGGLLDSENPETLLQVATTLRGQIPALVREVVERSKLAAIRRAAGKAFTLTADDVRVAAEGMLAHIQLMKEPAADTRSDIEKAADRLGTHIRTSANGKAAAVS